MLCFYLGTYKLNAQTDRKLEKESNTSKIFDQSDYAITGERIKSRFEKWLKKGEFEKTLDHQKRIEKEAQQVFDKICFEEIERKDLSIILKKYNADQEYFPVEITASWKGEKIGEGKLKIPISMAKDFKQWFNLKSSPNSNIFIPKWTQINGNFYPTNVFLTLDNHEKIEVNVPTANSQPIVYSTKELNIQNNNLSPIEFNYTTYFNFITDEDRANKRRQIESSLGEEGTITEERIFESVEINPSPKDGIDAFIKWMTDNYQYPAEAIDAGVKGTITVSFVVERNGELTDVKVLKDLSYGTGQAAINLLKRAKKWNPGIQNGRPVRVAYTLPIRLDLTQM